jgi:hypothetical protein
MPPLWDDGHAPTEAGRLHSRAHERMAVRQARRAKRLGYWRLRDSPHINLVTALVLLVGTLALTLAPRADHVDRDAALDTNRMDRALGVAGHSDGSSYWLSLPRYDLAVSVQGVPVQPELALESRVLVWGDRHRANADAELVVTEQEVPAAIQKVAQRGFEVVGLSQHPPAASPATVNLHVRKRGDPGELAYDVREVLSATATPLRPPPDNAVAPHPVFDRIRHALDREVQVIGQVLHVAVAGGRRGSPGGSISEVRVQPGPSETVLATVDVLVPDRKVSALSETLKQGGGTVTGLAPAPGVGGDRRYRLHAWLNARTEQVLPALRAALSLLDTD